MDDKDVQLLTYCKRRKKEGEKWGGGEEREGSRGKERKRRRKDRRRHEKRGKERKGKENTLTLLGNSKLLVWDEKGKEKQKLVSLYPVVTE